ncbi:Trehalose utilization protein [Rhizobiales bacterium GAS191]|nr:Trehalose utilization protein [Rhizobiales bacterium GAS188]SEE50425.1 Trehalose utilization protein [Rhizobiales bacterium GAS191]
MSVTPRIRIWNEYRHERKNAKVASVYPRGIHAAIADGLADDGLAATVSTLDESEHGLGEAQLAETDVLIWWGHMAHLEVEDRVAERVVRRVHAGMGLIALHSAHYSKVFRWLMGSPCTLRWRDEGEKERLWVTAPEHPIVQGVGPYIELAQEEMYGEPFGIPTPEELIFISWFKGGEVVRSGATFRRGLGRIFYFRPGHETFPTYFDPKIRRVIANACRWAAPNIAVGDPPGNQPVPPIEPIDA